MFDLYIGKILIMKFVKVLGLDLGLVEKNFKNILANCFQYILLNKFLILGYILIRPLVQVNLQYWQDD